MPQTWRVVRASDIAKLISPPTGGDQVSLVFGKIFEDEFTYACYLKGRSLNGPSYREFLRKVAAKLRDNDIYSKELLMKAYRMYACLLAAGLTGRKPKTRFAEAGDHILIAAQPDLELDEPIQGCWFAEFKTYPLDAYAEAQAKVFSYVLNEPVLLVGVRPVGRLYEAEEKVVDATRGFALPPIPDDLGQPIDEGEKEELVSFWGARPTLPPFRQADYMG